MLEHNPDMTEETSALQSQSVAMREKRARLPVKNYAEFQMDAGVQALEASYDDDADSDYETQLVEPFPAEPKNKKAKTEDLDRRPTQEEKQERNRLAAKASRERKKNEMCDLKLSNAALQQQIKALTKELKEQRKEGIKAFDELEAICKSLKGQVAALSQENESQRQEIIRLTQYPVMGFEMTQENFAWAGHDGYQNGPDADQLESQIDETLASFYPSQRYTPMQAMQSNPANTDPESTYTSNATWKLNRSLKQ